MMDGLIPLREKRRERRWQHDVDWAMVLTQVISGDDDAVLELDSYY